MNKDRPLVALTALILLLLLSIDSKAQTFEGRITYKTMVELPENSNIPIEQFKMMFQGIDTITNLYLKNSNYKLVTLDAKSNEPKTITHYDSDSNKTYIYEAGQNDFSMTAKTNNGDLSEPIVLPNTDDTLMILGQKCQSITIHYGQTSRTTLYFSDYYKVDKDTYKDNPVGFLDYIYRTGALPLKIIMSGNGAIHNMVFTAMEVKRERIKDKEFRVPKFKQVMESPF